MADQDSGDPSKQLGHGLFNTCPGPNKEAIASTEQDTIKKISSSDKNATTLSSQVPPHRRSSRSNPTAPVGALSSRGAPKTSISPATRAEIMSPEMPGHYSPEPPITRTILSGLEVSRIIKDPGVRHEINFVPDLHFRINLKGVGRQKKLYRARAFWMKLEEELREFSAAPHIFAEEHGSSGDWCLPKYLTSAKEIIRTLVLQADRKYLDDVLDVEHFMQQFYHGVTDLGRLASWLSRVLISCCAPMREEWIYSTCKQLGNCDKENSIEDFVAGLRDLLAILEAMKMDFANHQLHLLRPILIENTIMFERNHFLEKIRRQEMGIGGAKPWYEGALRTYPSGAGRMSSHFGEMGVFFEALSRSLLPSAGENPLPCTFVFDVDRLHCIRAHILDSIVLDVCMRMYRNLEQNARFHPLLASAGPIPKVERTSLNTSSLNSSCPKPTGLTSGPRNSVPSTLASFDVPPLSLGLYVDKPGARVQKLREDLQALLELEPHESRCHGGLRDVAPSLALHIFRSCLAPNSTLTDFEEELTKTVCNTSNRMYREMEEEYHTRLLVALATRVGYFKSLSAVPLFLAVTNNVEPPSSCSVDTAQKRDSYVSTGTSQDEYEIQDIATDVAHVGVIHWRVWARIAYLVDDMWID
ncbi:hypothetical protein FSARC_577 [Fusarium sarcochroum]|uniref:Uncharacterized protein n=1 Tax=Fusarium sarcochroum TaxID=1208366 RepID=A0A8H4UB83_9HYPO|nr:hypothetical protein FSARC_577 [Fusarium sarcochroum]